jgi:ligand-binding sensor domain-containing protein
MQTFRQTPRNISRSRIFLLLAVIVLLAGSFSRATAQTQCPTVVFTARDGVFTSPPSSLGDIHYDTQLRCKWLIKPTDAQQIRVWFSDFATEENRDEVRIFDGADTTAPLLAELSGANIDEARSVVSTGGEMLIEFITDNLRNIDTDFGWTARYVSSSVRSSLRATPENLDFGVVVLGKVSPLKSCTVTGIRLTEDVRIAAPRGYLLALSPSGPFSDTLFVPANRDSASFSLTVQFTPPTVGDFDKRISITSRTAFAVVEVQGVAPAAIYWEPMTGPYTAAILSMAADKDDDVYVGTHNGVYRSNTNGHAWIQSNDGLENNAAQTVRGIAVLGDEVFIATEDGVYKSNDRGKSWKPRGTGCPKFVHTIVVKGDTLLAGTDQGVFRTTDDGLSWKPLNMGISKHTDITALYIGESITYAATKDSVLYRSTNHGEMWTVDNTFGKDRIECFAQHKKVILAGTLGGWIYRTDSTGVWKKLPNLTLPDDGWQNVLALATDKDGVFYAGTEEGVLRSGDDGATWELRDKGLDEPIVTALTIEGTDIYAGTDAGIYVSENKAATWRDANTGLTAAIVNDMQEHRGLIFAATAGSGAYRSSDNGATWLPSDAGLQARYLRGFASRGKDLYVAAYDEYDPSNAAVTTPGIYRSNNNGTSWTAVLTDTVRDAAGRVKTLHPFHSIIATGFGTLLAGGDEGILARSTNGGVSWTRNTIVRLSSTEFPAVTSLTVGLDDAIFAGTIGGGIYRSDDDGRTWRRVFGDERGLPVKARRVNHVIREQTAIFAATDAGIYRSLSNGLSWLRLNFPDSSGSVKDTVLPQSLIAVGGALYAGTDGHGVWRSLNDGIAWERVNEGLNEDADVTSFAAVGTTDLYMGLHGGVVYRSSLQSSVNTARAFLEIPENLSAKPGEEIDIPILLKSIQSPPANIRSIKGRCILRFNASMLDPGPAYRQEAVVNGDRLIPLTFDLRPNAGTALLTLRFRARLGDAIATPLILTSLSADGVILLAPKPGIMTLTGLSYAGGARLFSSERAPLLAATAPNPISNSASIRYTLRETADVNVSVVNMFGQTVQTLTSKRLLPGDYDIHISTENIPPGAYFLVLQTPNHRIAQPLRIVR